MMEFTTMSPLIVRLLYQANLFSYSIEVLMKRNLFKNQFWRKIVKTRKRKNRLLLPVGKKIGDIKNRSGDIIR